MQAGGVDTPPTVEVGGVKGMAVILISIITTHILAEGGALTLMGLALIPNITILPAATTIMGTILALTTIRIILDRITQAPIHTRITLDLATIHIPTHTITPTVTIGRCLGKLGRQTSKGAWFKFG